MMSEHKVPIAFSHSTFYIPGWRFPLRDNEKRFQDISGRRWMNFPSRSSFRSYRFQQVLFIVSFDDRFFYAATSRKVSFSGKMKLIKTFLNKQSTEAKSYRIALIRHWFSLTKFSVRCYLLKKLMFSQRLVKQTLHKLLNFRSRKI